MWVLTNSGKRVDLFPPKPEQIDFNDIAEGLSKIVRFTGQGSLGLTVAEHSGKVSAALEGEGHSAYVQLWGLLHDAHEAYIGDISTPMKELLNSLMPLDNVKDIEIGFDNAIIDALGLRKLHDANRDQLGAVYDMDKMCGQLERGILLPENPDWPVEEWVQKLISGRGAHADITVMPPALAKAAFVTRYAQLKSKALREFTPSTNQKVAELCAI